MLTGAKLSDSRLSMSRTSYLPLFCSGARKQNEAQKTLAAAKKKRNMPPVRPLDEETSVKRDPTAPMPATPLAGVASPANTDALEFFALLVIGLSLVAWWPRKG